jgi:parallel beta-helix repeat protein
MRGKWGFIAGVAAAALALVPASAQASHVDCGDVITQDTTLDSDLVNCPDDGVVIGASGITLDLGGHTVDGTPGSGGGGVDNFGGHDAVTVTGGRISEFHIGVAVADANENVVGGIAFTATGTGVYLARADRNIVARNTFTNSGGVTVVDGCDGTRIVGNTISGPGTAIQLSGGPGLPEIPQEETSGTRIERNRLVDNANGIISSGVTNDTAIRDNVVNRNVDLGILASGGDTLIEQNTILGNGVGVHVSGQGTTVARNRVNGSAGDGILVVGGNTTVNTVIDRNVANRNGDDGIDVDSARTIIANNAANDNFDYGIEAVPGVTDGGGNRARGNGNPAQCLNVVCR